MSNASNLESKCREIIEARALATPGEVAALLYKGYVQSREDSDTFDTEIFSVDVDNELSHQQLENNAEFLALSANHAASIAQAYLEVSETMVEVYELNKVLETEVRTLEAENAELKAVLRNIADSGQDGLKYEDDARQLLAKYDKGEK